MSDEELQQLVEITSFHVFKKPFTHAARFNGRLRTTGGRYMLGDHSIEINPLVLQMHGMEELIGVIQHELCHYHLHTEGKGYRHRDADFRKLLKETASPRFCKPLSNGNRKRKAVHLYKCTVCDLLYTRQRKMDIKKYRCGKCKGAIEKISNAK